MKNISDQFLLEELARRFDRNHALVKEQSELLLQMEKINARLVQSEKVQSAFLSNIRNEINNPLTAIIGLAKEMTQSREPQQLARNASLIFAESFILEFQLQNIFIAAELEAGQAKPYNVKVNVKRLVQSTVEAYRHLLSRKEISISIGAEELIFRTDSEKLKIIVSNLLMNAIDHSPLGSCIQIETLLDQNNDLVLSIQDQGPGIPEARREEIFDRFVQLETGTTKRHAGHGLGLSVVKSMVEFVGGTVEVESIVGKGSRFSIRVPEGAGSGESHESSNDGNEFIFDEEDMLSI